MVPALHNIFISHTFLVLFFPLMVALWYYSNDFTRRQPVFILNVINLLLGITVAIMLDWRAVHSILVPIGNTLVFDIAIGLLGTIQSIFVDTILLIRIISVYPRSVVGNFRFARLIAVPVVLKLLRIINLIVFIVILNRDAQRPNAALLVQMEWANSPCLKIEWLAQVIDVTYASSVFLYKIYLHRRDRRTLLGPGNADSSSFGNRLRGLFWIACTNFVFPAILSLAQVIIVYRSVNYAVINAVVLANTDLAVLGVVFASVWAGGLADRPSLPSGSHSGTSGQNDSGDMQFAVRTAVHRVATFQMSPNSHDSSDAVEKGFEMEQEPSVRKQELFLSHINDHIRLNEKKRVAVFVVSQQRHVKSLQPVLMRHRVSEYLAELQLYIVRELEGVGSGIPPFRQETWVREEGGGGTAWTFGCAANKAWLEKAGVNVSTIYGTLSAPAIRQMSTQHASLPSDPASDLKLPFFAGGISIIIHPRNPNVPSVHANYRYFEIPKPDSDEPAAWWFGGVTDLTPAYLFEDDARHFHRTLKEVCDGHGAALYPAFKKSCDDYFVIPHRKEHRGLGGIRFDNLSDQPHPLLPDSGPSRPRSAEEIFAFVKALADAFIQSYVPIVNRRLRTAFDDRMRRWLLLRRGRSIEFSLVYERGTRFGLVTPGVNAENVLVGMPEEARWEYMSDIGKEGDGSEESKLMEVLKEPRSWVD
ncbi:hypothetical protein BV25DRAFT_1834137 [Artomyces pyxidatus]|uniref:Uncharacterized protein n=1 Tax=Artomyces pyxidatus TaxID=48021 RepID=A0ACB8TL43_9AGAM|nr:hypothetical protein BV25DRAFT_1834137 [Artomyces pyxidatus]